MPTFQPYGGLGWYFACLAPPSCISLFASVLVKIEVSQQGLHWNSLGLNVTNESAYPFSALTVFVMLAVDVLLYATLAFYFDRVRKTAESPFLHVLTLPEACRTIIRQMFVTALCGQQVSGKWLGGSGVIEKGMLRIFKLPFLAAIVVDVQSSSRLNVWTAMQVIPSEVGQNLPWYFPFQYSYWCKRPSPAKDANISGSAASASDLHSADSTLAVSIVDLQKVFSTTEGIPKRAVDGLTLDIYQSQITALLGACLHLYSSLLLKASTLHGALEVLRLLEFARRVLIAFLKDRMDCCVSVLHGKLLEICLLTNMVCGRCKWGGEDHHHFHSDGDARS